MSRVTITAALLLIALAGFCAPPAPTCTVKETVIGSVPAGLGNSAVVVSPDGTRVACWGSDARDGGKPVVLVDGKEVAVFDKEQWVWMAFSDDSRHVAYMGTLKGHRSAFIDGHAVDGGFDECQWAFAGPDGKPLFAIGLKDGRQHVQCRGVLSPAYDEADLEQVTGDRQRLWYRAKTGEAWILAMWEADGTVKTWPGKSMGVVHLSDDQRHWATTLRRDGGDVVLHDGAEVGGLYEAIDGNALVMSRDGAHVAFAAWKGGKAFVVVDGREYPAYDTRRDGYTPDIAFSADGTHVAYNALQKGKPDQWAILLDGKVVARHTFAITPVFGPGGSLVYIGGSGTNERVVIDGRIGPAYVSVDRLIVSPDGTRLAYLACKDASGRRAPEGYVTYGSPRTIVLDGAELRTHPLPLVHAEFIAGGRHLLAMAEVAQDYADTDPPPYGERTQLFVDGTALDGKYMDIIPDRETGGRLHEDGPAAFHFFATKPVLAGGRQVVRVDVGIGE